MQAVWPCVLLCVCLDVLLIFVFAESMAGVCAWVSCRGGVCVNSEEGTCCDFFIYSDPRGNCMVVVVVWVCGGGVNGEEFGDVSNWRVCGGKCRSITHKPRVRDHCGGEALEA